VSGWRISTLVALAAALALGAALLAQRPKEPAAATAVAPAHPPPLDAAQIATGRISMERMPAEVGTALETFSEEIVKTADAVESKQARITGTCAPGSAIRVIAADGSVRCQTFPKGVASVSALTAVARLSTTVTEAGTVHGGSGRYQSAGPDDYLVAPIALPDGAVLTSFSYTYFDGSPDVDTEAILYRSDDEPLAAVASSGADERVRTGATDAIHLRRIENDRYAYFVYFQISSRAGALIAPISASVSYRLP
jgi:hypothetical protein